jgi:putative ABC transport system permease protein
VARLLGKSNLRFSGDASSPVTFPDCADAGSAKILANDTNVQLAGTTFSGSFSAVDAEISGFYDASNDDANTVELLASTTLLQQLLDTDAVTYVAAFLKNTDDIEGQARRLQKRLRDEGVAVSVLTFRDDRVNEFYTGTMDFLNSIVLFVGLVVSMVIVLSIVNSMTMSVIERSREIGSLRALGFRRADILGIFVREAALLGFAGVLLGLFVAYTLALGVNAMGWSFHPPALASRVPFMLVPRVSQAIGLAVVLFALVLVGARIAVRRKVCQNIVSLLTHTAG